MSANEKPDGLEAELARRAREIESRVDAINLAAQPAQAGEAVAFGVRRPGQEWLWIYGSEKAARLDAESAQCVWRTPHEVVPLYAAPSRPGGAA